MAEGEASLKEPVFQAGERFMVDMNRKPVKQDIYAGFCMMSHYQVRLVLSDLIRSDVSVF
ncbi:hypothetical protein NB640_01385 [Oxalobacter vibrioformis]|uniref:Uncharacterized protein n=1 Tax=Oxalobacter vibrioformis TaxID=933080 RepID=A0A9E9P2W3_9BURK|nr:hypothetical protein [Oxalobacter vibrioformis]WAW10347.1 hypothetical protein NB640_01385 [Oxalobacter vibrioformis]